MWTGSVRRIQSECWSDTGERLEPISVYRCGETDKQICTKDILRKLLYSDAWPGSSSGRGSNSPRTADRVERYVQQTWTESMFGEDGGNVGGTQEERAVDIPGWEEA